jgi:hypothetical protein
MTKYKRQKRWHYDKILVHLKEFGPKMAILELKVWLVNNVSKVCKCCCHACSYEIEVEILMFIMKPKIVVWFA